MCSKWWVRAVAFTLLSGLWAQCTVIKELTTDRPKEEVGVMRPLDKKEAVLRRNIVRTAKQFEGRNYLSAGKKPSTGVDCSGFTSYVFAAHGIQLSPSARDQANQGKQIPVHKTRAGDLIFYRRSPLEPIFHVSLVVEQTGASLWVIHSTTSRGVIIEDVYASSYWKPFIYTARNVIAYK